MDFPKQSVEQARQIAERYKSRSDTRLMQAAHLYGGYFYHIKYGFDEVIKEGNCGRFLHEIKKATDCLTLGGSVIYLIARELGLKPRLWSAIDMRDLEEGETFDDHAPSSHTFVTVTVGKKAGQDIQYLVDPFMNLFGKARFDFRNHKLMVHDKRERMITSRHYGSLFEMTEQEYLAKVAELRKTGGGRIALSTTKAINAAADMRIRLTYLPQTRELVSSGAFDVANIDGNPNKRSLVVDLTTPVNDDGSFDLTKSIASFYYASAVGYGSNQNAGTPLILPTRAVIDTFKIWQSIVSDSGRKSSVTGISPMKLEDIVRRNGFTTDFDVVPNSNAARVIKQRELEAEFSYVKATQNISTADFVERVKLDPKSYDIFIRMARYIKELDLRKTPENTYGFVFSADEHVDFLRECLKGYATISLQNMQLAIDEAAIRAKLKPGTAYQAEREFNRENKVLRRKTMPFAYLAAARRSKVPITFSVVADQSLFLQSIEDKSIQDLEKEVTQKDIQRAAQEHLFRCIAAMQTRKEAFFLASFKRGLQRLLAQ